jgi:hypothetical protein
MARAGLHPMQRAESERQIWETAPVEYSLEQMARSLVESGDYRVTNRLEPQAAYNPPDDIPKLVAAVVDVEATGTNPDRDKIIELGICLFEYDRQSGRIYRVLGSWERLEDPGGPIPPEITTITGITDAMVAGHRIDDGAVNDLLGRAVLIIPTTQISIAGSWRNGFPPSRRSIGLAAAPILIGRPRVSAHLRSNSSPIPSGSSMMGIGLRAIVEPPSTCWRKHSPARGGSHCRLSWSRRDCRRGGYGREMPALRRRMSSRPAVTSGALESSGDQNAGIGMCRIQIRPQRQLGSEKT